MQCMEQIVPCIHLEGRDHPREVEDVVMPLQRCVELSQLAKPGQREAVIVVSDRLIFTPRLKPVGMIFRIRSILLKNSGSARGTTH